MVHVLWMRRLHFGSTWPVGRSIFYGKTVKIAFFQALTYRNEMKCSPLILLFVALLFSCAPPIAGPPVSPMGTHMVGIGGASGAMRELEPNTHNARPRSAVQFWVHSSMPLYKEGWFGPSQEPSDGKASEAPDWRKSNEMLIGLLGFSESGDASGAGAYIRKSFYTSPIQTFGVQVTGGMYFGSIGMPISRNIWKDIWLYSNPAFGFLGIPSTLLPIGATMQVGKLGRLHLEVNTTNFPFREGKYAGRPNHCNGESLGISIDCRRIRALAGFTVTFGKGK
jgi:hypothetical protein